MLDGLEILLADRQLGPATKLAFLQLWHMAGCRPAELVISADWLAAVCGRDPRSARDWIDQLEQHDLLQVVERNKRRGTIRVTLFNPCPGDRVATPDPQQRLALVPPATAPDVDHASSADVVDQVAAGGDDVAGVSARKPPGSLVPKNQETSSCQSTKEFKAPMDSMNPMDSMSALVTAAAGAALIPDHVQKERLKKRIIAAAGGDVADWVAGSAANLEVYHGVPMADIDRVLCDLQAMREAGNLRSAGRFLHAKFRELAARHGKPWPRRVARSTKA